MERIDVSSQSMTDWSMVLDSGRVGSPTRERSLESLIRRYWPSLYARARSGGIDANEANDVVQGFVADVLLERNLAAVADPARGRFRGLLSTAFTNYLRDRHRAETSKKRRPVQGAPRSLERDSIQASDRGEGDPEHAFNRYWVATVIQAAVSRVRVRFRDADRRAEWRILEARVIDPMVSGATPVPYAALVVELDLRDVAQAASYLVNGKKALGRAILEEIGDTVTDPTEIESDARELIELLERRPA